MKKIRIGHLVKIFCFVGLFFSITLQAQNNKLSFFLQKGHIEDIKQLALSNDGRYVFCGSYDKTITAWDIKFGKEFREFTDANSLAVHLEVSKNDKYLISLHTDGSVNVWDIYSGKLVRVFHETTEWAYAFTISLDGKSIILPGANNSIKIYDIETGTLSGSMNHNPATIRSIILNPVNGNIIAGENVNNKGTLCEWDSNSKQLIKKMEFEKEIDKLHFSPDGNLLYVLIYSGYDGGIFRVLDYKNHKMLYEESHINYFTVDQGCNSLALIDNDKKAVVLNSKTFKPKSTLIDFTNDYFISAEFTPDQQSLITKKGNQIEEWDVVTGLKKRTFSSAPAIKPYANSLSAFKNEWLLIGNLLWHFKNEIRVIKVDSLLTNSVITPDGKYIITVDSWQFKILDINTLKIMQTGKIPLGPYPKIASVSTDNKHILIDNSVIDIQKPKLEYYVKYPTSEVAMSPNGRYLASNPKNFDTVEFRIFDLEQRKIIYNANIRGSSLSFSDDSRYLFFHANQSINIYDIETGALRQFAIGDTQVANSINLFDNKLYFLGYSDTGLTTWSIPEYKITILDFESGMLIKKLHANYGATGAHFVDPEKIFVFSGYSCRLIDYNTGNEIISLYGFENGEWAVFADIYWDASAGVGNYFNMVQGMDVYSIDQFAAQMNRPDLILTKAGIENDVLKEFYFKLYNKRLKRSNQKIFESKELFQVPETRLNALEPVKENIKVSCTFEDKTSELKSYNIYVNDVPLFGVEGKPLNGRIVNISETFKPSEGYNKIEVSCKNTRDIESHRVVSFYENKEIAKKNLYFLGFGVSKYQNQLLNLKYADKDAHDLEKTMEGLKKNGQFTKVYTKVLTNEQVTPEAIKASKDFVKNAKPDDTFVLFIAGHGMHDTDPEATYYYLTSNADLKNLKATAADFETIEDLLQGIPPRNKLFLMDACESGEIDEEDQGQMIAAATGAGIASRGFKKATSDKGQVTSGKRAYLYQKDRYIYNDLVRRSGAIVFSSSKGGELSYERSDIENGLFTEYIMKALTTTEADKDGNGTVSTDELRIYVSEQVAKASGDLQHPTVDRDNIYQKFGFQVK